MSWENERLYTINIFILFLKRSDRIKIITLQQLFSSFYTDIDECTTDENACQGVKNDTYVCYNLDGGHNCTCINGYRWGQSQYECVGEDRLV